MPMRGVSLPALLIAIVFAFGSTGSHAIAQSDASPALSDIDTDPSAPLEAAPRIEMKEFRAFDKHGTATIRGKVTAPTKIFGSRDMYGATIHLIPDTTYSMYVEHEFRDSWLHEVKHDIDRGVTKYIATFRNAKYDTFAFEHLLPGRYLVFAEIADSAAKSMTPCVGKYPGVDAHGDAVEVQVPVYCYDDVRRDIMFLAASVTVSEGQNATVALHPDGEVTSP